MEVICLGLEGLEPQGHQLFADGSLAQANRISGGFSLGSPDGPVARPTGSIQPVNRSTTLSALRQRTSNSFPSTGVAPLISRQK
jgi:hypothetical protein